jgi:hypothetical protein
MGIDLHNLHFLAHARDLGARFDRSVTIGRQVLFVDPRERQLFQRLRSLGDLSLVKSAPDAPIFAEPVLQQWFGARQVDSIDASAYEGANIVHDLNLPLPPGTAVEAGQPPRYDSVIDFGCLEHVFNFPVAWRNVVDLCRVGGHVLHALPANNLSGHGFYQFSPELFFNLYRAERGFELRSLFFALKADSSTWWQVADPLSLRRRVNLRNSHEVYMLVLARKLRDIGDLAAPQQSDYAQAEWLGKALAVAPDQAAQRSRWQGPLAALGLLDGARRWREQWRALRNSGLTLPSPDYQPVDVQSLLAGARPGSQ